MSDNNNTQSEWREREIGALWKNEGRNQKYLSGHIKHSDGSTEKVVVFSNKNRNNDKAPHFRIYKSKDRDASSSYSSNNQSSQQSPVAETQDNEEELI